MDQSFCDFSADPGPDADIAHIWRSKFVDKCATAERQILRILRVAGVDESARTLLSVKMTKLRAALKAPALKSRAAKIEELLAKLKPLSDARTELVHSTISAVMIEGEHAMIIWAAGEPIEGAGKRSFMWLAELKARHREISDVANRLAQEAKEAEKRETVGAKGAQPSPASWPHPLKQAAAGGP